MVPVEQLNIFKQSVPQVRAETRVTVIDKVRKLPASPGQNFTKAIRIVRVCAHAGERGRTKESRLVAEASDHFGESRAPRIALVVTRSPPKKQQVSTLPQTFPQLPAARLGLLEVCGWRCNRTPGRRGPGPGRGGAGGRAGAG